MTRPAKGTRPRRSAGLGFASDRAFAGPPDRMTPAAARPGTIRALRCPSRPPRHGGGIARAASAVRNQSLDDIGCKRPVGPEVRDMAKAAVKSKKRAKHSKTHHRGVLDVPKAVESRMAEGRAERESVPLEAHAEWSASDGRPDPVWILEEQNATRVAELVPIRHGRMIVSPF